MCDPRTYSPAEAAVKFAIQPRNDQPEVGALWHRLRKLEYVTRGVAVQSARWVENDRLRTLNRVRRHRGAAELSGTGVGVSFLPLDAPATADGRTTIAETIADPAAVNPSEAEIWPDGFIDAVMQQLTPIQRSDVINCLLDGNGMTAESRRRGVSVTAVCTSIQRAKLKMRQAIKTKYPELIPICEHRQ